MLAKVIGRTYYCLMSEYGTKPARELNQKGHERNCDYATEILEPMELTEDDWARGKKLVDSIVDEREALKGVQVEFDKRLTILQKDGVIVVEPESPIRRTVIKATSFYEWQSPNEVTESDARLIIKWFKILRPNERDYDPDSVIVEAHSPEYPGGHDRMLVEEVYTFDITKHRMAIHSIDGYAKSRYQ